MTEPTPNPEPSLVDAITVAFAGAPFGFNNPPSPVRHCSAHGFPKPSSRFERCCVTCGASFIGLAPGRTGERGLWGGTNGWSWFCSVECAPVAVSQ